jgi:membrane-associated phospholipid phosphatase
MLKRKSGSLKKAFRTSKQVATTYTIKSILLIAVCFCFGKPAAIGQKTNFDQQVLIKLMENRNNGGIKYYQRISNTTQMVSALIPASVLAAGLVSNDKMTLKKGLYLAESAAAATFISYGMKYTFQRQRPFLANPNIIAVGSGSSPSFPSGHTSVAFASATSLTIAYPKWYVAVPAYAWAASVGYSRMYLGVHYPSDVLAGAVIGAGSAWLMYKANKWLFKKKPELRPQF